MITSVLQEKRGFVVYKFNRILSYTATVSEYKTHWKLWDHLNSIKYFWFLFCNAQKHVETKSVL